jgi:hypothetical protein
MYLPPTKFHMYLEDYYFAGQKHKYMEKIHWKALSDADLRKGTRETPINSTQPGKAPTRSDPCPTHSPPHEGNGEEVGQGAPDP